MASKSQSRNSSPKTPARRPRLMRAAATEPSLATSNASRKDLASLKHSSARATTLLTRVATYSTAQHAVEMRSLGSACSSLEQSPQRKEMFEITVQQSGNYFSFPSFEDFQEFQEGEERIDSRIEKGVP